MNKLQRDATIMGIYSALSAGVAVFLFIRGWKLRNE